MYQFGQNLYLKFSDLLNGPENINEKYLYTNLAKNATLNSIVYKLAKTLLKTSKEVATQFLQPTLNFTDLSYFSDSDKLCYIKFSHIATAPKMLFKFISIPILPKLVI